MSNMIWLAIGIIMGLIVPPLMLFLYILWDTSFMAHQAIHKVAAYPFHCRYCRNEAERIDKMDEMAEKS